MDWYHFLLVFVIFIVPSRSILSSPYTGEMYISYNYTKKLLIPMEQGNVSKANSYCRKLGMKLFSTSTHEEIKAFLKFLSNYKKLGFKTHNLSYLTSNNYNANYLPPNGKTSDNINYRREQTNNNYTEETDISDEFKGSNSGDTNIFICEKVAKITNSMMSTCNGKTKRYVIPGMKLKYNSAMRYCKSYNMQLVAVKSHCETTSLNHLLNQFPDKLETIFWIGGDRIGDEKNKRQFYWQSTLEKVDGETNWGRHQPDNYWKKGRPGGEFCMVLAKTKNSTFYKWHDYQCTNVYKFVCEESFYKINF